MLLLCVMAGLSTTTKRAGLTCNSLGNLHRPFEFQLKKFPDSKHRERSGRITRDFFFSVFLCSTIFERFGNCKFTETFYSFNWIFLLCIFQTNTKHYFKKLVSNYRVSWVQDRSFLTLINCVK